MKQSEAIEQIAAILADVEPEQTEALTGDDAEQALAAIQNLISSGAPIFIHQYPDGLLPEDVKTACDRGERLRELAGMGRWKPPKDIRKMRL